MSQGEQSFCTAVLAPCIGLIQQEAAISGAQRGQVSKQLQPRIPKPPPNLHSYGLDLVQAPRAQLLLKYHPTSHLLKLLFVLKFMDLRQPGDTVIW